MDHIITDIHALRQKSRPTSIEECKELEIFQKLETTLKNNRIPGFGLSAIQIGIPIRAFIIRHKKLHGNIINPVITKTLDQRIFTGEGCLSFPGKYIKTHRYHQIACEWTEYSGEFKQRALYGFPLAVIFQHETDHLEGMLFFDRALQPHIREERKMSRNDPCHCQSGKKFKKCCGK